jgi:hypothetical protein
MNTIWLEAVLLGLPVGLALGLVGGGGSILTVPILIGLLGLEPKLATTASLVIVTANALIALVGYGRGNAGGKLVRYGTAFTVAAVGLMGSALGTLGNHLVDARALTLAFAALMTVIAVRMLSGTIPNRSGSSHTVSGGSGSSDPGSSDPGSSDPGSSAPGLSDTDSSHLNEPPAEHPTLPKLVLVGTLIGLTTGFFGVGGGFIIVPGLVWLGLPMRQAVPTSLLVIALNGLVGLVLRVAGGSGLALGFALPMILGGVIGSSLAVRIAPQLGNRGLARVFAVLVFGLAAYIGFSALRV